MFEYKDIEAILLALGFTKNKKFYTKSFEDNNDAYLKVDIVKKQFIYPEDKGFKASDLVTNFEAKENIVVFECVNRLFEKGYEPKHIELEPKWKLGHGASGGRADIMIKDFKNNPFLIIECKTFGNEFTKEWNNMLRDGGQLFSYAMQDRTVEHLSLYASDYVDGKIIYNYNLVSIIDNDELLEHLKDKEPLSYKNAKNVVELFNAWKDTYNKDFVSKGIFENSVLPYQIGSSKISIDDLSEITANDIQGKYHEFATILRQHNVSGRENAFDKLVNLFLCKIVDETNNPNDLQFYWRGVAYDNYFNLQDRIQRLYKSGMMSFLNEDVTYIDNKDIDEAFRYYKADPDATQKTIQKYFRELKFFTNNDFAFIDVHNEKLFFQNGDVLKEIVQILQDIKLKTENENQFLGDMFEGFLDQGIKQSEGQFFTPIPIVKFILKSLPLESLISDVEDSEIPKVIDYACGAGHFLNEYASEIKPIVEQNTKNEIQEYYKNITGIEKEYRLSKVAKVSAFMYGQDEINIVYGDALSELDEIQNNCYSVLVANPPYSVKGFLDTISNTDKKRFELLNSIDEKSYSNNNSIEAFFIERAKQLLKAGGVGAIIVPSSILNKGSSKAGSKSSNVYVGTREILLKYFDIVAIAEFGSGTFGKTGTNTVTLFLRRKESNPNPADHFADRVNSWFDNKDERQATYQDEDLLQKYCSHLEYSFEEYKTLLNNEPSNTLLNYEVFKDYKTEFEKLADIKSLKRQQTFKAKTTEEQEKELNTRFVKFIKEIEQNKVYYFVLAYSNPQQVLIVKSPSKSAEIKDFLGYEWSSSKGNEGIKYLGTTITNNIVDSDIEEELDADDKRIVANLMNLDNINTPLYDPKNDSNDQKINTLIRKNFDQELFSIPEELTPFVSSARLVDMLDFEKVDFNKDISLTPENKIEIESKWSLVKLGDYTTINIGGTPSRANSNYFKGNNLWVSISEMNDQIIIDTKEKITGEAISNSNVKLIPKGTTLLSFKLSIGKTAIAGVDLYTNEAIAGIIPNDKNILTNEFLFHLFSSRIIDIANTSNNAFGKSLNKKYLESELKIPLPPKAIQEKIVKECGKVDDKIEKAREEIKSSKERIASFIDEVYNKDYPKQKISQVAEINVSKSEIKDLNDNLLVSFVEMASVSEKGYITHREDRRLIDVRKASSYKYFRENDIILAKITPCMENGKCAIATNLTNEIGFGSSEFHVFRANQDKIYVEYLFALLNRDSVRKEAEKHMTGSSGHRRVPESFYANMQIPVPNNLKDQKSIIDQINKYIKQIQEAELIIENSKQEKEAILKKHL